DEPSLDLSALQFPPPRDFSLDDSEVVVLPVDPFLTVRATEGADMLRLCELELEIIADARLRVEAGRLAESLGDFERARAHYDAALMAEPGATRAMQGLRRLARANGDHNEALRLVALETARAAPREREPLLRYQLDLLLALRDLNAARE